MKTPLGNDVIELVVILVEIYCILAIVAFIIQFIHARKFPE